MIYQDSIQNQEVSFEVFGVYDETRFGDKKLRQLGSTDLYYRCYKFPTDICFLYRFNVKNKATGKNNNVIDKYNPDRVPTGRERKFTYSVFDLRKKL